MLDGFKLHKHWWTPLALIATLVVFKGLLLHTHLFTVLAIVAVGVWIHRRRHQSKVKAEQAATQSKEQPLALSDERLAKLADAIVGRLWNHRPDPSDRNTCSMN